MNPNSILFLFEGDTEELFYRRIFNEFVSKRTIRIFRKNLKGINSSLNYKVLDRITNHLNNNPELLNIHVFVAFDREGPPEIETYFSEEIIRTKLKGNKNNSNRIRTINDIVATQDIESWFFYDIDGIYDYLRVKSHMRSPGKYSNPTGLNNTHLSKLFREHGRAYIKGKSSDLIPTLNIRRIYESCGVLRLAVEKINSLML